MAVSYAGPSAVSVAERRIASPGPGDLLIEVAFCGVCGSDLAEYRHGPLLAHISGTPHRLTGHRGPVVLGHEFAGYVAAAGDGADFTPGTLVACSGSVSCGTCPACVAGETNLCPDYRIIGLHQDGGLASHCVVPASACVDAGSYGISPSVAALAQPMAIAVHAVRRGHISPGERAAVVGVGGVGAFLLYAACETGAAVTAIDTDPRRFELARALGAVEVIPPSQVSPENQRGYDVVFEVSGTERGLATALSATRRGGRVVLVGLQPPSGQLGSRPLILGETSILGSFAQATAIDLPEALRVLSTRPGGWRDVAPRAFPLSDIVTEGFTANGERVKTLFAPSLTEATDVLSADRMIISSHAPS
jgi:(R,R)-butanediol dehydrogenase/meso-butanediol dehydrogenase/diacetyl reductase